MNQRLELSIVIPVYNEKENIAETLTRLQKQLLCPYEVLIVYDFDEDTTVPIVQQLSKQFPESKLIKNDVAPGPSGAIRTGFSKAQSKKILVMMADLCDDIGQIPQLLDMVPVEADLISPSRYCRGGKQVVHDVSFFKIWIPKIANLLLKHLIGMPSSDSTNSFKIYSADLIKNIKLVSTVSFSVTLEIIVKAHSLGYRIKDIPTVWLDRQRGKSNFKLIRSLLMYIPWFILAFFHNRLASLPNRRRKKQLARKNSVQL